MNTIKQQSDNEMQRERWKQKEPFAWLCKNGHGNSHNNLNCWHCGAKA